VGWTLTLLTQQPLEVYGAVVSISPSAVVGMSRLAFRSGSKTAGPRRRPPEDDIPLATRTPHPVLSSAPPRGRGRAFLLGSGLAALAALGLLAGPLRSRLQSPPVASLNARPDADGRLLGHFPYPEAAAETLVEVAPGQQVHRDAAADLVAMQEAARADGVQIVVLSGFRSLALQQQLFFEVKAARNQSALDRARVSAPPGYSEHSTGYAVDLGDARAPGTNLSTSFESTAAYRWLQEHAAHFHFLASFPRHNPQGVSYEPWHWRYEGSLGALKLFEPAQRLAASASGGNPLR